jgi:transcriptional regulator with XRE-family HTH domain
VATTRQRAGAGRDRTSQLMLEIRGRRRQDDVAALSGLTQSRISRAEQGKKNLSAKEAKQYAEAVGATAEQVAELVRLCSIVEPKTIAGQARVTRDGAKTQDRIMQLEEQSELVRGWQPTLIIGQLQVWDYTTAAIEGFPPPDDPWTLHRLARIALLDDPARRYEMVMSEAALRWVVGSRTIMARQLEHLVMMSERPNLDIAFVPFGQTVIPPPEGPFHLFGDRSATVATDIGTTFTDDRKDLDALAALHGRLMDAAVHDDDARDLIRRAGKAR